MQFKILFVCTLFLYTNFSVARRIRTCSEKWQHRVAVRPTFAILGYTVAIAPTFGISTLGIGYEATRIFLRAKAIHLLRSADKLYQNYVSPKAQYRLENFYNNFIAKNNQGAISINQAIEILALYDQVAYATNRCYMFKEKVYITNNKVKFRHFLYPQGIAKALFVNGQVRPEILAEIAAYRN